MLLYVFCYSLDITLSQQYLYVRIAQDYNYTGPQPGGDAAAHDNCTPPDLTGLMYAPQQVVQRESSTWYTLQYACFLLPGLAISTFMGAYSDRVGRKVALIAPLFGSLLASYLFVFINIYNLPKWTILLGYVAEGISGSLALFFLGGFSYIADVSSEMERAFRFLVLEAFIASGFLFAGIVSGFLIQGAGFLVSYLVLMGLVMFNFVYVSYFIEDSIPETCETFTDRSAILSETDAGAGNLASYFRRPFEVKLIIF